MKVLPLILISSLFMSCSSCNKSDDENTTQPPTEETLTDEQLLDLAQKDALKYFWDYAETNSKLARERYHTDDPSNDAHLVTTGGTGFGIMTIIAAVDRGFVSRADAVTRLQTGLDFLQNADRFHGAWPHWIDGTTGHVVPFGTTDNGGDLVETSYLCQALICLREYFKNGNEAEQALATQADNLWKGVEWSWYTQGGQSALYWHWSPNYEWQMNLKIEGYNECLITYVMAAASPTHPIGVDVYTQGWARNGAIDNAAVKYNLPVVFDYNGASGTVGPMFWSHYSYLGLDPRGLSDQYADYWTAVKNHTDIMHAFCVANPHQFTGYSDKCWGLTASYTRNSDGSVGYAAHQPNNDRGVISPTAALSSFPYSPENSMKALRFFYQDQHDQLIGVAGPYDAFSIHYNWYTKRYLAIDQGTIVPMIENYRSGLLWNLFMQAPEVKQGLLNLGFHSTQHGF